MRVFADYHTHTTYSHGKGRIEENVQAAIRRGLKSIGITDHGPGHFFIGVKGEEAFRSMQAEIRRLRAKYPQIEILFGVEANIVDVDGTIDVPEAILPELDILLVGYHKLVKPQSLAALKVGAKNFLSGWLGKTTQALRDINTKAICAAVRRYPVMAVTHPGLQIDIDTLALANICAECGTLMEINSSYAEKLDDYVKTALTTGVNFVINSDAHTPERVGDFTAAYRLLQRLNVPAERVVNLERGKRGVSTAGEEFIHD
ncbi:MAG: PHP domain-containing protein [Firmicutes bacterium]|nr:PHP domain-containing protein [Bacillota bacterium]